MCIAVYPYGKFGLRSQSGFEDPDLEMKRILTDAALTLACVPVAICGTCVSQFRRTGYSASDLNQGLEFLNSKYSD